MTRRTLPGRTFVSHHTPTVDLPPLGVAKPARHILVRAFQRESCAGVMIEPRGGPPDGVMACRALDYVFAAPELAGVNVLMATLTSLRRGLEWNLPSGGIASGGPVTISAAQNRVRAFQGITRGGMIEGL